jgi:hypothetical protein
VLDNESHPIPVNQELFERTLSENPVALGADSMPVVGPKLSEKEDRKFVSPSVTPEFLLGLFKEQTQVQAARIADLYKGKWIRISCSLHDVSSFYNNKILVTIKESNVIMIFDNVWADRLEILRNGDNLTVIGKITNMSNISVRLEHCELTDPE